MITLLSNICPASKRPWRWGFSEILRRQLFARITLPWFMSVEREKCPSFLSTAPFPGPVLFLQPSSIPFPPSPPNQPRLTLNLQRESRFLSSSIGLALVHNIPATKQRQFPTPVPSLLFIFLAFTRISFEAWASWFYDLGVMVLSDNPVSYLDLPSFGIFQLSRRRFSLSSPSSLFSFFRETCLS